jgi:hypothetical protein
LKPLLGKFSHDVHYIPQENTHLISKIKNENYRTIIKNQHTYTKLAGKRYDGPAVNLLPQVQVHIFKLGVWFLSFLLRSNLNKETTSMSCLQRTNGKISPSPKHKRMNNYKLQNRYFWAQP